MTEVLRLVSHPLAARIGLALLHFVWQGAVLGVIAAALLLALRRAPAASRYAALLAVLAAMALCPVVTFLVTSPVPAAAPAPVTAAPQRVDAARVVPTSGAVPTPAAPASEGERPARTTGPQALPSATRMRWMVRARAWALARLPWISLLWLAGVVVLSLRFLARGWSLWRLRGRLQPAAAPWPDRLAALCQRLALSRPVKLMVSSAARVPMVIGWLRPVVVLPASALTGLTPDQVGALLAHELAHLRRHDHWVALGQALIELLLFYHPAVWWVSRALRAEREHCCDDAAVAASGDLAGYLRALAWVDEHRGRALQPALASSGSPLLARIRRLGGCPPRDGGRPWLAALLSLALAMSILLAGAFPTAVADSEAHRPGLRDQWQPQTEHDPRLSQPVHIEILGRAAVPALELLSKETGVTLQVAPENLDTVGERKLTIIAQGCSLKSIMVQIPNALQECHWDIDTSGREPVYLLHRNGSMEATMVQLLEEEPAILAEGTRPAREARIAAARAALAMSPDQLKELAKTDPLLAAAAQDSDTRRTMELFFSLPEGQMQEFTRTGWLPISMSSASSGLQQSVRDFAASRLQEARQKDEHPEFWQGFTEGLEQANLTYQDTDRYATNSPAGWGIILGVDTTGDSGMSYGDSALVIPPHGPGDRASFPPLRELLIRTGLDGRSAGALLADLAKQAEQERLVARDQRRQREWREPRSPALHKEVVLPFTEPVDPVEVQRFLATETGLSFISDYFTEWGPRPIPEEARVRMPVWRLLYLLGEYWFWTYDWNEVGDCLVFHDRMWCSRSLKECPESLVTAYRERLAEQGALTLDDAAAFATELERRRPRNPKLRALSPAIPLDLEEAGFFGHELSSGPLLLYATLTPEQKVQASTEAGLAYAQMTSAQQARVAQIGQPLPGGELAQAVFRVTVSHKTVQEILKELGMPEGTPVGDLQPQNIQSLALELPSRRVAVNLYLRPAPSRP
jgi:beta-lactamase regulating signal transducer with metallopeptidase domain